MYKLTKIIIGSYFLIVIIYGINHNNPEIKPSAYNKNYQITEEEHLCYICNYITDKLKQSKDYPLINYISNYCYTFTKKNDIQDCLNLITSHIPHIKAEIISGRYCAKLNICK